MKFDNYNKPNENDIKNRKERFQSTVNFLKRIDFENIVEDNEKKDDFIKNISFDKFNDLLLRINGLLRDISTSKREFNAGKEARYMAQIKNEEGQVIYNPPLTEDKIKLLHESLDALKRMIIKGERYDGAVMMGAAINAIHPFEDGNGRTSRVISTLLASSKNEFKAIDPNPEIIQPLIEIYLHDVTYNLKATRIKEIGNNEIIFPEMNNKSKNELQDASVNDLNNIIQACNIYCKKEGEDFEKVCFAPEGVFCLDKFIDRYKDKIMDFMGVYRALKNKYVKVLIDIFENPQKYALKNIPSIIDDLPSGQREIFEDKTLKDLMDMNVQKDIVIKKEFSYDLLIKFIKDGN
jgi:hypothetical protein